MVLYSDYVPNGPNDEKEIILPMIILLGVTTLLEYVMLLGFDGRDEVKAYIRKLEGILMCHICV
mgnify:FL=1